MLSGASQVSTPSLPSPIEMSGGSDQDHAQQNVSRKINQSIADRVDDQLGGLVGPQNVHHIGTMDGDRVGTEVEHSRNLLVGLTIHDHLQDFKFARGEARVASASEGSRALELG